MQNYLAPNHDFSLNEPTKPQILLKELQRIRQTVLQLIAGSYSLAKNIDTKVENKTMIEETKSNNIKQKFLFPIGNYQGEFTPQNLAFNANLQLFAQQVMYLCNLEANGKMKPEDTYDEIKKFWKQLKHSKKQLLDNTDFTPEE